MPRAGNGSFTLAAGYQATDGQTATAAQHNDPLEDLETVLNENQPITKGGTGASSASGARTNLSVPGLSDDNTFSGANNVTGGLSKDGASVQITAQCALVYSSTTEIVLEPRDGNLVQIAGALYEIPAAGVTMDTTGLSADTAYYVYIYDSSGTLTLEASATAPARDTTAGNIGVYIETGDATRTYVGYVTTDGSTQFASTEVHPHFQPGTVRLRVFDAGGTWTKLPGLKAVEVLVVGAGGGGGGSRGVASGSAAGAGGSGGGASRKLIPEVDLGATETVTIGSGGAGGVSINAGATGGTSSFGSHASATGGEGGAHLDGSTSSLLVYAKAPGAGSGGDLNLEGYPGERGITYGGSRVQAGAGGGSILGGGGKHNAALSASANGSDAVTPGAGGAGAQTYNTTSSHTGGDGADGVVTVTEIY